jgi:hypothetical protein
MKPLATSFQKNCPFVCPFALSDARVQARSRRVCRSLRALHQLHFKRRILGSRECESAGIDRYENGVNALLGVSYSIDSSGTVSQPILRAQAFFARLPTLRPRHAAADIPPNRGAPKLAPGDIALVDSTRAVRYFGDRRPGWRVGMNLPGAALITHLGSEPSVGMRRQNDTLAGRLFFQVVRDAVMHSDTDIPQADPYLHIAIYDLLGALFSASDSFRLPCMRRGCFDVSAQSFKARSPTQKLVPSRSRPKPEYLYVTSKKCLLPRHDLWSVYSVTSP